MINILDQNCSVLKIMQQLDEAKYKDVFHAKIRKFNFEEILKIKCSHGISITTPVLNYEIRVQQWKSGSPEVVA